MEPNKAWILLIIAGLLEICWVIGVKYTEGFSKMIPSIITIGAMTVSMYLLSKATTVLPIGTAYAVWVGIGAAGAAIFGIVLFQEPLTLARGSFLFLLIVSIIGLKWTHVGS